MSKKEASMEELFQKLDEIVEQLESGEISLEETFGAYKEGMEVLKKCSDKIDLVEKKMLLLNENGELSEF